MSNSETTSQISSGRFAPAAGILSNKTKRVYRRRGMNNLLRMGHCAPAVMQTLLDRGDTRQEQLVKMTAGLPGGIGNTGFECGAVTSVLIQMGLDHGLSKDDSGLPSVITLWHDYTERFGKFNGSLLCKEILGTRRVPLPCIKAVRHAKELYSQTGCLDGACTISGDTREAFCQMYSHLSANGFHCAHAVLNNPANTLPVTRELLDGTSGFIGGTAFKGLTCSAFTAGLIVVGQKLGEIEGSYLRVARMLAIMVAGGIAFADHLNKFNRLMNIGHRMSKWFREEYGSTLCRDITQCDFSSRDDVNRYIEKGTVAGCKVIAEKVAKKAEMIIQQNGAGI